MSVRHRSLGILGLWCSCCWAIGCGSDTAGPADTASSGFVDGRGEDVSAPDSGLSASRSVTDVSASPDAGAAASDGGLPIDPATVAWCDGATEALWDPAKAGDLTVYPDDYWTRDDPSSPTGLRVAVDADHTPWIGSIPGNFQSVALDLATLDGWSTLGAVMFRFSDAVQAPTGGWQASVEDDAVQWWELGESPHRIPYEVQPLDDGATLLLWPMVPLRPATRYGVLITGALAAADGGCIAPSQALREALTGATTNPDLLRLQPRLDALVQAAGVELAQVSAAAVFTTQSVTDQSEAIAADIASRDYGWDEPASCEVGDAYVHCEGAFLAADYRGPRGVIEGTEPRDTYALPVSLWLPLDAAALPAPVVIYGHGLGSGRSQARHLAAVAAPLGAATVAVDAVDHGDHPGAPAGDKTSTMLAFFGADIATLSLDALVLRDNFRQSVFDRLQLVELLRDAPDIDGDGTDELDPERISYVGVSLGGIMGAQFAALSPHVEASVLSVAGGRLVRLVSDSDTIAPYIPLLLPPGYVLDDFYRFLPVFQTLIDAGDPANYAGHIAQRLPAIDAQPASVLITMAVGDTLVPNTTSEILVRAAGAPAVAPVAYPIDGVGTVEPPLAGNAAGGAATVGFFEYDRVRDDPDAPIEDADHNNTPGSYESFLQIAHFLETLWDTGLPEVIDPYAVAGTPPLE